MLSLNNNESCSLNDEKTTTTTQVVSNTTKKEEVCKFKYPYQKWYLIIQIIGSSILYES